MTERKQNSQRLSANKKTQKDDVESIKIRVSVYFDGTLNNRTNIDQRLLSQPDKNLTEEERKDAIELNKKFSHEDKEISSVLYKKYGADNEDESNSYEGYYTNIAIMEKYIDKSEQYNINLQTYIEGSGTIDKEKDSKLGYIFGIWATGIPKKVAEGVFNVVNKIKRAHQDKDAAIEEITFDVFGFSRGAAAARNFIHEALDGENSVRNQLVENFDYKINSDAVRVCFVGLYDTVSAYGFWKTATDIGEANTKTLKLDAIAKAKQVVQLAAANEHREYFSLTNIKSARGDSREIFLPGVHSDIGGGYRDNATENQVIYEDYGYSLNDAKQEVKSLIASGWFREDEIFLDYTLGYEGDEGDDESVIRILRHNISNKYSRIPLHLMAGYAKKNNVSLQSKLDRDEEIPGYLLDIKQKIEDYIANTPKSNAKDWQSDKDQWLRDLRHDYFHFSARNKTGHTPRYNNGKRSRLTLQG